jgi:hypothetical protein
VGQRRLSQEVDQMTAVSDGTGSYGGCDVAHGVNVQHSRALRLGLGHAEG